MAQAIPSSGGAHYWKDKGLANARGAASLMGVTGYTANAPTSTQDLAYSNERDYGFGLQQGVQSQYQDPINQAMLDRALGRGPSAAELQTQAALGQAAAASMSQANSARGMNRVAAQRAAIASNANAGANAALQGQAMRAQEMAQAQGAAAQTYSGQQQQNIATQQLGQGDQQAILGAQMEAQRVNADIAKANAKATGEFTKDAISSVGSAMAIGSDIRLKNDIKPMDDLATAAGARAAGQQVEPTTYRYNSRAAELMGTDTEPRMGVMAQDLERSGLNKLVVDTPEGKAIDGQRAISALLALAAGTNQRIDKLEGNKNGSRRRAA